MSSLASAISLNDKRAESWSKTHFKVVKLNHVWTIENFSFCELNAESLKSPLFSADPNDQMLPKWQMELSYSKSQLYSNYGSMDMLTLCLHMTHNNKLVEVTAKYKFGILDEKKEQKCPKSATHKFAQGGKGLACQLVSRETLFDKKNALLPDDCLSIFCEISMVVDTIQKAGHNVCAVPQCRFVDDMDVLLEEGLFSDFVLCSGNVEFKVHKNVLACRSPVFAAMLTSDTEEKRTNRAVIKDISAPVLGQLLRFIYTGCEPPLLAEQSVARELLMAADKYQLDRLKALCEQQLCLELTKDNVLGMLVFADRHNADQLKTRVMEYICRHTKEVLESDGWRTLISAKSHSELAIYVLKALTAHQTGQSL